MLSNGPFSSPRRRNLFLAYFFAIFVFLHYITTVTNIYHEDAPPSVHLVLSTLSSNNYSWATNLSIKNYSIIPYMVDDQTAQYHTPANQGNEAMGYLTYMYDFYDNLPDISIFLHGQDYAWHVDAALQYRTANALNRLDLTEVLRRQYMNLRISWENACPNWMNTSITIYSPEYRQDLKSEEPYMKEAFESLFPDDPLPEILAAPCCSQFAVTREIIRAVPRERYQNAMTWLQNGHMSSSMSGRIWEHLWQWLFLRKAVDCPAEHIALCRNYHICFDSVADWEQWRKLEKTRYDLQEFKMDMLRGDALEGSSEIVDLTRRIEDLESKTVPWRERAIATGENVGRRKEIAGA